MSQNLDMGNPHSRLFGDGEADPFDSAEVSFAQDDNLFDAPSDILVDLDDLAFEAVRHVIRGTCRLLRR